MLLRHDKKKHPGRNCVNKATSFGGVLFRFQRQTYFWVWKISVRCPLTSMPFSCAMLMIKQAIAFASDFFSDEENWRIFLTMIKAFATRFLFADDFSPGLLYYAFFHVKQNWCHIKSAGNTTKGWYLLKFYLISDNGVQSVTFLKYFFILPLKSNLT